MTIYGDDSAMYVDLDRFKVVYIFDQKIIKLINPEGKEIKREAVDKDFTVIEFKEKVKQFQKLIEW